MNKISIESIVEMIKAGKASHPNRDVFDDQFPVVLTFTDEGSPLGCFDVRDFGGDSYRMLHEISKNNLIQGTNFVYVGPAIARGIDSSNGAYSEVTHRIFLIVVANSFDDIIYQAWDYDKEEYLSQLDGGDGDPIKADGTEGPVQKAVSLLSMKLHVNNLSGISDEKRESFSQMIEQGFQNILSAVG